MAGTGTMDGPVRVGQCPIYPGDHFVYEFKAYPAGSYWYHSHDSGQVSVSVCESELELIGRRSTPTASAGR